MPIPVDPPQPDFGVATDMTRYFFDVENSGLTVDEEGSDLDGPDAVPAAAMRTLLDIARFEVVSHDQRRMSVTARDVDGTRIYRADLTVRAGWLDDGSA